jgi:hypothetical protein
MCRLLKLRYSPSLVRDYRANSRRRSECSPERLEQLKCPRDALQHSTAMFERHYGETGGHHETEAAFSEAAAAACSLSVPLFKQFEAASPLSADELSRKLFLEYQFCEIHKDEDWLLPVFGPGKIQESLHVVPSHKKNPNFQVCQRLGMCSLSEAEVVAANWLTKRLKEHKSCRDDTCAARLIFKKVVRLEEVHQLLAMALVDMNPISFY